MVSYRPLVPVPDRTVPPVPVVTPVVPLVPVPVVTPVVPPLVVTPVVVLVPVVTPVVSLVPVVVVRLTLMVFLAFLAFFFTTFGVDVEVPAPDPTVVVVCCVVV